MTTLLHSLRCGKVGTTNQCNIRFASLKTRTQRDTFNREAKLFVSECDACRGNSSDRRHLTPVRKQTIRKRPPTATAGETGENVPKTPNVSLSIVWQRQAYEEALGSKKTAGIRTAPLIRYANNGSRKKTSRTPLPTSSTDIDQVSAENTCRSRINTMQITKRKKKRINIRFSRTLATY